MSTYLIASNEMMCRVLARRLNTLNLPQPIAWRTPQWLQESQHASMRPAPSHASAQTPADPADIVVVDCTGLEGDPRALLDQLQARLAPRRWLVLSDRLDPALILHAALLGASGCLALPAAVDLVCAATALVWAGGQCFPRMALSLTGACPVSASLVCASRPTTTG
ncbi:response regulator [Cupriavidus necator]|uniref:Response regulator n=1 Tax=Cupriavidus necator TaxID=106590 RepID=A0A1U9UU13_CUPNE|nr:response regulator transcription factor [Cupriavidus necator]AQV96184.1 response regulator [Cupriavidus necator]